MQKHYKIKWHTALKQSWQDQGINYESKEEQNKWQRTEEGNIYLNFQEAELHSGKILIKVLVLSTWDRQASKF